jgi:hypothetical protein
MFMCRMQTSFSLVAIFVGAIATAVSANAALISGKPRANSTDKTSTSKLFEQRLDQPDEAARLSYQKFAGCQQYCGPTRCMTYCTPAPRPSVAPRVFSQPSAPRVLSQPSIPRSEAGKSMALPPPRSIISSMPSTPRSAPAAAIPVKSVVGAPHTVGSTSQGQAIGGTPIDNLRRGHDDPQPSGSVRSRTPSPTPMIARGDQLAAPGRISLGTNRGSFKREGLQKDAGGTPVAVLTGGTGQQQCATCVPGQNYVLAQTNDQCPQGNCTFKFLGNPGCGSGGPSCWQLVSSSSSQPGGASAPLSNQPRTATSQYFAPSISFGPSSSDTSHFSDDLQAWLHNTDDPLSRSPRRQPPQQGSLTLPGQSSPADVDSSQIDQSDANSGQSNDLDAAESNIWDSIQDAISNYRDSDFYDDVVDGAKTFENLELSNIKKSLLNKDVGDNTEGENLGYALVSASEHSAIDAVTPKTGDPEDDTMNTLEHTLAKMRSLDWTLSAAIKRVKTLAGGMKNYFGSNLDTFADGMRQFSVSSP